MFKVINFNVNSMQTYVKVECFEGIRNTYEVTKNTIKYLFENLEYNRSQNKYTHNIRHIKLVK